MSTSAGRFLVKSRLFVLGTALLTKMLMAFWSHGTCSRAANMCVRWFGGCTCSTEDVIRLSYPAVIPARGWGPWVRYLRQLTAAELHQQLFDADPGARAVFGLWALRVDSALRHEDSVGAIGDQLCA